MYLLFIACLVVVFAQTEKSPLTWRAYEIDPSTPHPVPRREAVSGYDSFRNCVVMFGGRTVDEDGQTVKIFNDTWVLDLNQMKWTQIPTSEQPPPTFAGVGGVIAGDNGWFILTSGDRGEERTNSTWVFALSAVDDDAPEDIVRWYELTTYGEVPLARFGSAGGMSGTTLYLSHGFDYVRYSDTYSLDLTNLVKSGPKAPIPWTHIHHGSYEYAWNHPHSRSSAASTVTDSGFLVMFGGCLTGGKFGGPCPSRDSWVYWIDDGFWDWTADGPGQSMYGSMAPIVNDDVLLWGGEHNSRQIIESKFPKAKLIHVLTPLTGQWRRYEVEVEGNPDLTLPTLRHAPAIFASLHPRRGDAIVMWGGSGDFEDKLDLVYILSGNLTDTTPQLIGWYWWTFWHIHGIFMFASWGVILQLGACIARYGKRGGTTWLTAHKICQVFGVAVAFLGLVLGFVSAGAVILNPNFAHSVCGIFIFIFMILQPLNGFLRPDRSSSKHWIWQIAHKAIGWFLIILALINIVLGLFLALLNRLAWAAIAWAIVVILGHIILTLLGFAKDDSKGDGIDYTAVDEGLFRTSEVFKAGTKGGTSSIYTQ